MATVAFILVMVVLVFFLPWNELRGPINHYVSGQLGRRFEITQHLAVHLRPYPWGRTTVRADGVELANPEWADEPYLLKAASAEFEIELWPLLFGNVNIPRMSLMEPIISLQIEPDGRRTWALARDTSDVGATPTMGLLTIDHGTVKYKATARGADMTVQFSLAPAVGAFDRPGHLGAVGMTATDPQTASLSLPLRYQVAGLWNDVPFTASGRAGGVLQLSQIVKESYPLEIYAVAGKTTLEAKGSIESLEALSGLDASFDIHGNNLEDLYKLWGVVLPSTPPFKLHGNLQKNGGVWSTTKMSGTLGGSDISGDLTFDTASIPPLLTGQVQSKILDFKDLRPVIGLPVVRASQALTAIPAERMANQAAPKVLPTATLDLARLQAMNADVTYNAADIRHVEQLPLDNGSVHVQLTNGVLQLVPVALGVAGGSWTGRVTIDVNQVPASFEVKLAMAALQLNQLFPTVGSTQSSLGKISGKIDLKGRGNSVAQMLGSASGEVAVLMGKGAISNLLLEFVGLDGGEIIKFLLRGDRNVPLRCAAAAFEVRRGLMTSRVIVLDTTDTVINGTGRISLADETLDITLYPQPKDRSILSLRSPLKISGTFAAPYAGPDKLALAGRAGLTLALGLVNPLLALATTLETGQGQDADCSQVLALAADPRAKAPSQASSQASSQVPGQSALPRSAKPVAVPNTPDTRP